MKNFKNFVFESYVKKDEDKWLDAIQSGDIETIKNMISKGFDVNYDCDHVGTTALMMAARFGHLNIVKELLSHGVDINSQSYSGWNALMYSINSKHTGVALYLINKDANLDLSLKDQDRKNENGWTALMMASALGLTSVITALIKHKAKLTLRTEDNQDFYDLACTVGKKHIDTILPSYPATKRFDL